MALSLTSCFLTQTDCTEVERYGVYDLTSSTVPTLTQCEEYCYDVAAILVTLTERAGSRQTPPVSGISDTHLARLLTQANAIGAAFLVRQHQFLLNGDDASYRQMQVLSGYWQSYVGQGSSVVATGLASLQIGTGGLIETQIVTSSGSRLMVTPMSQGEVDLEDLATSTQNIVFTRDDKD